MSSSYQMRMLLWCTLYCALSTLRFGRTENLSLSSRKYARYVTFHDASTRSLIARTRGYNSCMQTTSLIGISAVISSNCCSQCMLFRDRDCTRRNIMLDPTNRYPKLLHPVALGRSRDFRHKAKAYSRTRRPTRYLLIDFGLSR